MNSRTKYSVQNAKIAIIFYVINLILQFFSRKIFIEYLGAEVLGLNTTLQNILGMLNIAELGIGAAIAYSLYKPVYNHDRHQIEEIVSVQGWLYRRIAFFVIGGAIILMAFFPFIFRDTNIPGVYIYGTFIAFLTSSLLGYFVNYKQIILTAVQKEYKNTFCVKGGMALKVIAQIFAIKYFSNGYLWWIIIEFLSAFIISGVISLVIKREFPWLHTSVSLGGMLRKKYPMIIVKTKQMFFHKIAGFVLTQTSPLIIYAYTTLTLVAAYGNYFLIVMGIVSLMNALTNSITASVGNLVAEGNIANTINVFWKIAFLRILIAGTACFTFFITGDTFISLWVGSEYIIPKVALCVMILNMFLSLTRTNDMFIAAYGLYQDIWAPLAEAILNIGFSCLFGYFYGLAGILSGISVSLILIVHMWKPYFLFIYGFNVPVSQYILRTGKYLLVTLLSMSISYIIYKFIKISTDTDTVNLIISMLVSVAVYIGVSICLFCISDKYPVMLIREFTNRILKNKI